MDVEHLWQYNESELSRLNQTPPQTGSGSSSGSASVNPTNPLLVSAGLNSDNSNPDLIANLCNVADHRLYKIVKWCKSLPLFKHITVGVLVFNSDQRLCWKKTIIIFAHFFCRLTIRYVC